LNKDFLLNRISVDFSEIAKARIVGIKNQYRNSGFRNILNVIVRVDAFFIVLAANESVFTMAEYSAFPHAATEVDFILLLKIIFVV
jgi:hypothetical protein